ncbi:hypothetical protein ALC62_10733 [Cyphomyrmex costatus]|uniref:Uncharacterized protein n=1 Tax=Cyphomyrmex costatus TaxID=456900 RepID=A0A195CDJ6_9HYME|nr:hypothetical protein ALC62_10733 [Cyphomyrmex costatus]
MKFLERSPGTTPQGHGAWGCAYREREMTVLCHLRLTRSANLKIFASGLLYLREPLDLRGLEEARLLEVLSGKSSKQITHITADKFQPPRRGGESSRCLRFQELCGGTSESLPDRENRNWDTQVIPGGFP